MLQDTTHLYTGQEDKVRFCEVLQAISSPIWHLYQWALQPAGRSSEHLMGLYIVATALAEMPLVIVYHICQSQLLLTHPAHLLLFLCRQPFAVFNPDTPSSCLP